MKVEEVSRKILKRVREETAVLGTGSGRSDSCWSVAGRVIICVQ